jgi:dipeptidase E
MSLKMKFDKKLKQIIAMGGGGFSMEPENPLLDQYILAQSHKANPGVCFIPTASAESPDYILKFYDAFLRLGCRPSHLSLFHLPAQDLEDFLLNQDILYVGGGNTRSMLALWHEWDLERILKQAWERGIILSGISAGAICWFEQGVTDSFPGELNAMDCLGFLEGSCCPHYNGEPDRRPAFQRLIAEGKIKAGIALDDGVAIHFVDDHIEQYVSSRPGAYAYRVEESKNGVSEQVLMVHYLGTQKVE